LEEELKRADKMIAGGEEVLRRGSEALRAMHERLRRLDSALRVRQDEEREVVLALERLKFDEERINVRRESLARTSREAGMGDEQLRGVSPQGYPAISQEDLRRKIERLRVKLEEIGGIDGAVVKEYEETEARHAFLTKELEDLKAAHVSLKALVKELDQYIKKDFKEGFAKIKDEFHHYFRIIFGGGAARLRIMKRESLAGQARIKEEEGVPSEALAEAEEGIEIEVDLPRKRIHGLAMLSGGERALTAIALLFAITAVNPPPFLVLDETDAALDEANSRHYANILKELAKKTQLILVTHNRETMKSAGILYGVTMGEDGVSRLLSLKLEEAEEYTNG
jgi:chromosome segregation protein